MTRPRLMPRLAATLWVALFSARAWATAPSSEHEKIAPPRNTAIYLIWGLGTPEGFVGLEAVHRFGDYLELAAGIGGSLAVGLADPHADGTQWSIMPRVRSGGAQHNFTFGAGMSGGPYTNDLSNVCFALCDFPGAQPQNPVPTFYTLWANVEIGGEYWSRGGFAVRYYLGYAHGMPLSSPSLGNRSELDLPYFGIGLGYAF